MFSDLNDDALAAVSRRLCLQAASLRARLRAALDAGDVPSAVDLAERSVGNDCIVALLAMAQCVVRDPRNDFRPVPAEVGGVRAAALTALADAGLATLGVLYEVGGAHLKHHGWVPAGPSAKTTGGILYEHEDTGERSEEPDVAGGLGWQMRLILSIPVLITPGLLKGEVVWAATVVYYRHGGEGRSFDLEAAGDGTDCCVSVIDLLKSDEEGDSARLRGIHKRWRGLYAEAMGEMEVSDSTAVGQNLEQWTETTLAGLAAAGEDEGSPRILVVGLAGGQLVSFLRRHITNAEIHVVEESQTMVDIAIQHFGLCSSDLRVSVVDPREYLASIRDRQVTFDVVIVNVCSSEDAFPPHLLDRQVFTNLVSLLSDRPSATLMVNSGESANAVAALVGDACGRSGQVRILRELLLRDHEAENGGGAVVAAGRREWTLSVESWQSECMGDGAQVSGSMDVADAQRTQVVRLEKFLSSEEIDNIHKVARSELASFSEGEKRGDAWNVLYLQHNDVFKRRLPDLRQKLLDAARRVDSDSKWHLFDRVDHVNIRVVEYHQMQDRGELADLKHYDLNSLITMDVMLSEPESFEGGDLQTLEANRILTKHTFEQGDALLFVSHKYHCVGRVTSGRRNVMVIEFWHGPERRCNHRCERFGGQICDRDPGQTSYTRQHPSLNRTEASSSTIPLPFRLGSVSVVSVNDRSQETLELLWEPSGSGTNEKQPSSSVDDKVLCDLFGEDSCSDSDEE
ncbi:hypothetical protein ACHAXT_009072 [Thalassiosira profunda]